MAKCDIKLETARSVPAGGTLDGEVVVTVHESIETKALKLRIGWRTHGRGNRDQRIITEQTLFAGTLVTGEMRFPFAVSVPAGPLTFHGENINVEWFAAASVDLPWALDPKVDCVFTLMRPEATGPYVFGTRTPATGQEGTKPTQAADGCASVVTAGIALSCAVASVVLVIMALVGHGLMLIGLAVFLLAFGGIWAFAFHHLAGQKWANRRTGTVKVSADKMSPVPGDLVRLEIDFTPKRNLQLNNVLVFLTCIERAVSGSGTNESTYTNLIHEERMVLRHGAELVPGRVPIQFTQLVQIPPDAPPSFASEHNEVIWRIAIQIDIEDAIDWQDAITLAVRP